MDKLGELDWNLIRAFLAVAETGSLSAAARRLGQSQPTLGRQVQTLEDQLGATLFHRRPRGLKLAEAGLDLIGPARSMQEAAATLALAAAGAETEMAGTVRITASVFTAVHHLPPILAGIRRDAPEIVVELVASDTSENLLFREADIALRMYRPDQLDVVTKHLGGLELGIYASRDFLDRHGTPAQFVDVITLPMVGYDRDESIVRGMQAFGLPVTRSSFAVRCDNNIAYAELIRAGCGVGFVQCSVADRDPHLVRLFPDVLVPTLPVWLTCPEAVRRTPRVRFVWDRLAAGIARHLIRPDNPRYLAMP